MTGQKKIVVVEDDRHQLKAPSEFLERSGYSVLGAQNGQKALDELKSGASVSLILLDLSMPVMDGWEFLKRQRNDPAIRHIPVVVLTTSPRVPDGPKAVLQKPIELDSLRPRSIGTANRDGAPTCGNFVAMRPVWSRGW
jgi:CheY-like chemotaxis protein